MNTIQKTQTYNALIMYFWFYFQIKNRELKKLATGQIDFNIYLTNLCYPEVIYYGSLLLLSGSPLH